MATRRRKELSGGPNQSSSTPAQDDEADILEEAGAERDEETGELTATEDRVRELGAVDAESVRANRRTQEMVNKKRANVKNVTFNTGDLLSKYDAVINVWPSNTLDITVRRLTGTPVQQVIISRPRSGIELYEALKIVHGAYGEAEYEVKFQDTSTKQWCGTGRITMPDTRPQQGQQPMNPYYQPPGYPPPPPGYSYPPGYPPLQAGAPPQQPAPPPPVAAAVAAPAPMPPPVYVQTPAAPAGPDMAQTAAFMRQMFEMFQGIQATQQPQLQHAAPLPPPQIVMPQPPANPDPASMVAYMQQMLEMFRSMQLAGQPAPAPYSPPPAAPVAPDPMASMRQMFEMFREMQAMQAPPARRFPPEEFRDRPRYEPPSPPPRERTAKEQFQDAIGVVRSAIEVQRELSGLIPGGDGGNDEPAPTRSDDDDSPIKIIDTGQGKIVVNKKDGTMRAWETGWANMDKILKWAGEQTKEIGERQTRAQQSRQQPPQQQLPPGYVEVHEGYKPPPGWVAVPETPPTIPPSSQVPLPPPPQNMPPPIQRTWEAPTVPERES